MSTEEPVFCPCGAEIVQGAGESIRQYEKRRSSGYCRAKCKKEHPRRGRVITLDTPARTAGPSARPSFAQFAPRQFTGTMFKVIPEEDEKYLKWIRTQPCLVPGCGGRGAAHHQNEAHDGSTGSKCSDRRALPLCHFHHNMGGRDNAGLPGCYHAPAKPAHLTGRTFLAFYAIDPEKKIKQLNAQYDLLQEQERERKHGRSSCSQEV